MATRITRHVRIPLFARLTGRAGRPLEECYSTNISAGGMYFKALGGAEDVAVGSRVELGFELGDLRLKAKVEVVWTDAETFDYRGTRAHGFGVRFVDLDTEVEQAIQRFIASFRYHITVIGASEEQREVLQEVLGSSYDVTFSDDARGGDGALDNVAALLLHRSEDVRRIAGEVLSATMPTRLVYCARKVDDEALRLVNRGVVQHFLRVPLDPVTVRTVVGRAVETFALLLENERLTGQLERAVDRLNQENRYLRSKVARHERHDAIVGESNAMRKVRELIDRVAPLQTTVHISGETGTGKELVARALHAASPRATGPFVAQDCPALSESLLESQLFGHAAGSFTGARTDRAGLFEEAHGGTVFLDEIGNLPTSVQAKMLRVLEERQVRPVGATQPVDVDVRLISASNRDLREEVRRGRFRRDLYYRLVVFSIDVPPLRARRQDIPALALHFLEQFNGRHAAAVSGFDPEAVELLEGYDWPGNVRELQNEVERAAIMCGSGRRITPDMLSECLRAGVTKSRSASVGLRRSVAEFERELIQRALDRHGGVVSAAAAELGLERTTLTKKCARLGIALRAARGSRTAGADAGGSGA